MKRFIKNWLETPPDVRLVFIAISVDTLALLGLVLFILCKI
jgi:hypothetical protein